MRKDYGFILGLLALLVAGGITGAIYVCNISVSNANDFANLKFIIGGLLGFALGGMITHFVNGISNHRHNKREITENEVTEVTEVTDNN